MRALPWLRPSQPFPDVSSAWPADSPAPGLLAAGGALDVHTLLAAYSRGIFPWFSTGQPVLWWSPDPRMVLRVNDFRLHRSMRKTLQYMRAHPEAEIRVDHDFRTVIESCATSPRPGQSGTWIVSDMVEAYVALHAAGHAHSFETWFDGELAGGLYLVNVGCAVFGESMFARRTDASKLALCALVAFCKAHGIAQVDCQQNTAHLASLGATEVSRETFLEGVARASGKPPPAWRFDPVYWNHVLPSGT